MVRKLCWLALPVAAGVILAGCSASHHGRFTFAQLTSIARGVPVPTGVQAGQLTTGTSTNGTTGGQYREVQLPFTTSLDCAHLEAAWEAALAQAHREFATHGTGSPELHYIEVKGSKAGISIDMAGYPTTCKSATLVVTER